MNENSLKCHIAGITLRDHISNNKHMLFISQTVVIAGLARTCIFKLQTCTSVGIYFASKFKWLFICNKEISGNLIWATCKL